MHAPTQFHFDLSQLGAQTLRDGTPLNLKAPFSGLPADMREAQKGEACRFPQATLVPSLLCEATELDQAGFLGVQLQAKLGTLNL